MNILEKISKTNDLPPRITIYGKSGIGKTSIASQFPNPLFILTENPAITGLNHLPVCESFPDFYENIKLLLALEVLPFETIVIDSISKLDALIVKYILEEESSSSSKKISSLGSASGGYGKGYERAQNLHRIIKSRLDKFIARGVGIIFIGHMLLTKYKAPDLDDYDIYSIVMNHDKSREVYIDDVDAVLFGKLHSNTYSLESGRTSIKSSDKRVLVTTVNDSTVTKNRYSMPSQIPMEFEEIAKYIPWYNKNKINNNLGD